jgi:hypothetical protein
MFKRKSQFKILANKIYLQIYKKKKNRKNKHHRQEIFYNKIKILKNIYNLFNFKKLLNSCKKN